MNSLELKIKTIELGLVIAHISKVAASGKRAGKVVSRLAVADRTSLHWLLNRDCFVLPQYTETPLNATPIRVKDFLLQVMEFQCMAEKNSRPYNKNHPRFSEKQNREQAPKLRERKTRVLEKRVIFIEICCEISLFCEMISPIFFWNFNQKLVKFWEFPEKLPLFWKFSASKTHQKGDCCYCCRMSLLVSSRLQNTKELSDRVFECETEKQFLQLANDFHVLGSTAEPVFCKSASSRNKFLWSWNLFVKLSNFPAKFR